MTQIPLALVISQPTLYSKVHSLYPETTVSTVTNHLLIVIPSASVTCNGHVTFLKKATQGPHCLCLGVTTLQSRPPLPPRKLTLYKLSFCSQCVTYDREPAHQRHPSQSLDGIPWEELWQGPFCKSMAALPRSQRQQKWFWNWYPWSTEWLSQHCCVWIHIQQQQQWYAHRTSSAARGRGSKAAKCSPSCPQNSEHTTSLSPHSTTIWDGLPSLRFSQCKAGTVLGLLLFPNILLSLGSCID